MVLDQSPGHDSTNHKVDCLSQYIKLTVFHSTKNPPDFVRRRFLKSGREPSCRGW